MDTITINNNQTDVFFKLNEEKKGVEIYFTGRPSEEVRTELKTNGFRWSSFNKCWYSRQNAQTIAFAEKIANGENVEVKEIEVLKVKKEKQTKTKAKALSLWEATQWEDLNGIKKEQECKELAKEIRSHIRKRFPQCKFSVTVPYYGRISFEIKATPFEKESTYLEAIKAYCESLLKVYQHTYDEPDHYSDYAGSYNFSGWVSVAWDYKQLEVTDMTIEEMKEFDARLEEFNQAEQARKDAEYQEFLAQQQAQKASYEAQRLEEEQEKQFVQNNVKSINLDENEVYHIVGAEFAHLNKNDSIAEYVEEVTKGDYSKETVKITKELHFTDTQALDIFSNSLMLDFDFLEGSGGSYTNDARINSMVDYDYMDESERSSVEWNHYGVAVYCGNELQFVVDAQGYSYARYVGLTENAEIVKQIEEKQAIESDQLQELKYQAEILEDISTSVIEKLNAYTTWKNEQWKEYKTNIKEEMKRIQFTLSKAIIQQLEFEELKLYMYKVLTECDSIREQFEESDLQQGEKLTLYYLSDRGTMMESRIILDSVTNETYAQYDNAIKLTFKQENKRKLIYTHFHGELLVYRGWQQLPTSVLNEVSNDNNFLVTRSKYASCDKRQYDEILQHFNTKGIVPTINTYKPIF